MKEFERRSISCTLLMTGQHLETMQDLLNEFGIRSPQLTALAPQQVREHSTIGSLIRWLPNAYSGVIKQLKSLNKSPADVGVLVHGDTASTVIGAIAARRFGGRVVHLESGLTSGRLWDPFPEEISRRIVFRLAHVAMCPSVEAAMYMRKHYKLSHIHETEGNTILDAVSLMGITERDIKNKSAYLVASLHRFQNIYDANRLRDLICLLERVSESCPIHFVLHPATQKRLLKNNLMDKLQSIPNINLSPRLGYGDFLRLAAGAACVLTDGGSNQEELAALGIPTIVMRKSTERSDGLGKNAIMEEDIADGVEDFLASQKFQRLRMPVVLRKNSPSEMIANVLLERPFDV